MRLYAIGPKTAPKPSAAACRRTGARRRRGPATTLQVTPTELHPQAGRIGRADASARSTPTARRSQDPGQATWTLEGLKGTIEKGRFTADASAGAQAGTVKATVGALSGAARIRVVPDLPWTFDFEDGGETPPAQWVNATGKFAVRDVEGSKVLVKLAQNPFAFAKRTPAVLRPARPQQLHHRG